LITLIGNDFNSNSEIEKTTDKKTQEVMQYIEDTWMTSTVWTVPTWSVFNQAIRTNNNVEGWHHQLAAVCK
jgi:hypothetical protein